MYIYIYIYTIPLMNFLKIGCETKHHLFFKLLFRGLKFSWNDGNRCEDFDRLAEMSVRVCKRLPVVDIL